MRRTTRGCGVAVVILAVGALLVQWRTGVAVDQQVVGLRAELRAFEEEAPAARSPLEPVVPGNAVIDYQVVEWVFSPRDSWKEDPPGYLTNLRVPRATKHEASVLGEAFGAVMGGWKPSPESQEVASRYRFLLERVRRGLSRERCEWPYDPREGIDAEGPSFSAYTAFAGLVAMEAKAHPQQAFRLGTDLAALGRDVASYPDLLGLMMGGKIEGGGCRLIVGNAGRSAVPAGPEGQRLLRILEGLPQLDLDRALTAERLGWEILFAEACGDQIMTRRDSEALEKGIASLGLPKVLLLSEWRAYERTYQAMCDAARLPPSQRQAASDAVRAEARAGWNYMARLAISNLVYVADAVDDVEAERTRALKALRAGLE